MCLDGLLRHPGEEGEEREEEKEEGEEQEEKKKRGEKEEEEERRQEEAEVEGQERPQYPMYQYLRGDANDAGATHGG